MGLDWWVLCFTVFQWVICWGWGLIWKLNWGRIWFQAHSCCWQKSVVPGLYSEDLTSSLVLARRPCSFWPRWPFWHEAYKPRRQTEKASQQDGNDDSCNVITEMTFHHLGCVLLVTSKSWALSTLTKKGATQGCDYLEVGSLGTITHKK